MNFETILGLIVLIMLAFIGFFIYFVFKQIEFVVRAVNLYKKIIAREEVIIKLLIDIRDNTKHAQLNDIKQFEGTMNAQESIGDTSSYETTEEYLTELRKIIGTNDAVTFAREIDEKWICVCGTHNSKSNRNCSKCHMSQQYVLNTHNESAIRSKMSPESFDRLYKNTVSG